MKRFKNQRSIFGLWAILMLLSNEMVARAMDETRLIVSADSLNTENPYRAFYSSLIFMGVESPIIVEQPQQVFESQNAVYFSTDIINADEIILAQEIISQAQVSGVTGASFYGFPLEGSIPEIAKRYLGAAGNQVNKQVRRINNKVITAFAKNSPILWPKNLEQIRQVPAVIVTDSKSSFKALMSARLIGHLANKLVLIEELLNKSPKNSYWLELGSDWGSLKNVDALLKRKPTALFLGISEMAFIAKGELTPSPEMLYPFKGHSQLRISKNIDLWSVAKDEKIWSLLPLGKVSSLKESLSVMNQASADADQHLNIVRVYSDQAAREAANSTAVDLVIKVADDPLSQFAEKEIIELKNKQTDSYEQVAPIIQVSSLDVTEISLKGPSVGNIESVIVTRHQILDKYPKASDIQITENVSQKGLPKGRWSRKEFKNVLGGVMTEVGHADVALFKTLPEINTINGEVSYPLLLNLIKPEGSMAVITLNGAQVKNIAKLSDKKILDLEIYGIDAKSGKIGKRSVNDNEAINVALSDEALLELYSIGSIGALNETRQVRAPFVEGIYGDVRQLFFAGGPKNITTSAAKLAIEQALARPFDNQFDEVFSKFFLGNLKSLDEIIAYPNGKPHHVLTLDISYLDIGLSTNVANDTYKSHTGDKNNPLSRGTIPVQTNLYALAKVDMTYDAEVLLTSLTADVKYMHNNMAEKPLRDKTKLGLRFRLPWERTYFEGKPVVISPIFQNEFETKLVPNFWSRPAKLTEPRPKRLETLLGLNFAFTKLGFNMDMGGMMVTDFRRALPHDAIDMGPAVNFSSKWSLYGPFELSSVIKSYYLFSLPKNKATNKVALGVEGTAWLRVAQFHDFSLSLMSDFLVTTLQETPKDVSLSSIFGLTFSYGRLFRIFG